MLCLGRKLDFEVPFHSRIGQTGIYLKEPDGSREFLSLYCWVPGFSLNLSSAFLPSCWPWIEMASHLPAIWFLQNLSCCVSKYLPREGTESPTKSGR